ncbi:TetR/AcrR family transcriptional regulator, partial [Mycobacterium sp. ITM-2017-0098]
MAVLQLDDPGELLDGWARVLAGIDARVGGLFAALEAAATVDEGARGLFDTLHAQRRDGARRIVDAVATLGGLRDGMTRSRAVDVAC